MNTFKIQFWTVQNCHRLKIFNLDVCIDWKRRASTYENIKYSICVRVFFVYVYALQRSLARPPMTF